MLLIIAPEERYIKNLIKKMEYTKKNTLVGMELYTLKYKEHKFLVMVTGYGKVNIINSLRYICDNYDVKVIVQIGTAGSISDDNDIFNAVVFNNALQFDVDFSPNDYAPGVVPGLGKGVFQTNNDLRACMQRSCSLCGVNYTNDLIASGDMFVCNSNLSNSIRREFKAGAVDVESGVTGQFAYQNDIPYVGVKIISNFAYNNAIRQYKLYEEDASLTCQKIVYKFIKEYYE